MNTELTDHLKKSALSAIINLDTSSVSAADLMFTEFESNEVITSLLFLLAFNDETNNKFTLNEKIKDVLVMSIYQIRISMNSILNGYIRSLINGAQVSFRR
ncbi:hypothetical protein [Pseudoalteromonas sp. SR43-5]|uniref:hypothetical protein n=1 Tax=Pseudoalteromonas sp. SR43-5 TaxID=2760941 RepID=UPI0015F97F5C|nr:hypothetical protein [Pseudoalteromonas sp. SR43-5]MBB1304360.1 hypothetical protein [Pseudoalteromonas sp. SR43-5]